MTDCLQCGKEIEIVDANSKYKKFCNRSCSGTYNNSRREIKSEWWDHLRTDKTIKEKIPKIKKEKVVNQTKPAKIKIRKPIVENCVYCGILIPDVKQQRYCSEECRSKGRLEKIRSKQNIILCPHPFDRHTLHTYNFDDKRKLVKLYNIDNLVMEYTMLYSRYLMCVHLGRILEKEEHVDHINNDPSDDRLENLQILSGNENNTKHNREVLKGRTMVELICPCGTRFIRERNRTHLTGKSTKLNDYCNRQCMGKFNKTLAERKTIVVREFHKYDEES